MSIGQRLYSPRMSRIGWSRDVSGSVEKLIENLEFGLHPRKTYDVDELFFNEFR